MRTRAMQRFAAIMSCLVIWVVVEVFGGGGGGGLQPRRRQAWAPSQPLLPFCSPRLVIAGWLPRATLRVQTNQAWWFCVCPPVCALGGCRPTVFEGAGCSWQQRTHREHSLQPSPAPPLQSGPCGAIARRLSRHTQGARELGTSLAAPQMVSSSPGALRLPPPRTTRPAVFMSPVPASLRSNCCRKGSFFDVHALPERRGRSEAAAASGTA